MFGISFGKKKTSGTTSEDVNRSTNTTGSQNTTNSSSTVGSQNTQQTGTSSSQGSSNTRGETATRAQETGQQQQQTQSQSFSDTTLAGLEGEVARLLGVGSDPTSASNQASSNGLSQMAGFDANGYVDDIMRGASADTLSQLEESIGGVQSTIGGTAGTNSAAALLTSRLEGNRASNLAGIRGQATGQAQEILARNVASASGANQTSNTLLTSLAEILKGGRTTGTAATTTANQSTGGQSTSGNTQTSESSQQSQNTNTQTVQDVLTQITELLNSTENMSGSSRGTNSQTTSGGGLSLGF
jgi:hypothetical protein